MVDVLEEHRCRVRRLESEHVAKGYELDVERLKVKAIEACMLILGKADIVDGRVVPHGEG
jgi:DNA-binding Lrp family transcriptional regulator